MASSETVIYEEFGDYIKTVKIVYVAHTDGTVAAVTINSSLRDLLGSYLVRVRSWPTSGGTAPDAADVTVKDENLYDLLEAGGVNLIHATAAQAVAPKVGGTVATQLVLGDLVVAVANQATSGATFNLALDFVKEH